MQSTAKMRDQLVHRTVASLSRGLSLVPDKLGLASGIESAWLSGRELHLNSDEDRVGHDPCTHMLRAVVQ